MKKFKFSVLMLLAVAFALGISFVPMKALAADVAPSDAGWDSNAEEEDAFGNIMHTGYAKIDSVTFAAPAAGAPCKVSVKATLVGYEDEETPAKLASGKLTYIINGDLKGKMAVDLTCTGDTCTGEIPGQASGAKVAFAASITDSYGNTTMEGLPVATPDQAKLALIDGKADMDNSKDIVPDDMDLMGTSAGFDKDRLYVSYSVQGKIAGGTIDPPYIQLYGIKVSNPDIEQNEGLMVGKLWINLPLAKDKTVQDKFMPLLMQAKEYVDKINKDDFQKVLDSGQLVLDIGKLMSGNIVEGLLFTATPEGEITNGNTFTGSISRAALGDNPSGFVRVIMLTAANASIDSFMPIPLNCSHYMQVVFKSEGYSVQ